MHLFCPALSRLQQLFGIQRGQEGRTDGTGSGKVTSTWDSDISSSLPDLATRCTLRSTHSLQQPLPSLAQSFPIYILSLFSCTARVPQSRHSLTSQPHRLTALTLSPAAAFCLLPGFLHGLHNVLVQSLTPVTLPSYSYGRYPNRRRPFTSPIYHLFSQLSLFPCHSALCLLPLRTNILVFRHILWTLYLKYVINCRNYNLYDTETFQRLEQMSYYIKVIKLHYLYVFSFIVNQSVICCW